MTCSLIEAHLRARPRFGVVPLLSPTYPSWAFLPAGQLARLQMAADMLIQAAIEEARGDRPAVIAAREVLLDAVARDGGPDFAARVGPTAVEMLLEETPGASREDVERTVAADVARFLTGPLQLKSLGLWPTPAQIAGSAGSISRAER
jgi:hypothetical protein